MSKFLIHMSEKATDKEVEKLKLLVHKNLDMDCEVRKDYVEKGVGEYVTIIIMEIAIQELYSYLKPKFREKVYPKLASFFKDVLNTFKKINVLIRDNKTKSVYVIPNNLEKDDLEEALRKIPVSEEGGYFIYDAGEKEWKQR